MYDENTFKNYIFWLKVKRVFYMLIFSIVGAGIGVAISEIVVNILTFESSLRPIIIIVSTLLFFAISLLSTAGTAKEVQDGYWKIAVLRKLTVISKKLDNIQTADISKNIDTSAISSTINDVVKESISEDSKVLDEDNFEETSLEPSKTKAVAKVKKSKSR